MPLTIELLLLSAVLGRVVMLMQRPAQPATAPARITKRCETRPAA